MSLFPNVPPFLNYIPSLDGGKIFPPSRFREQLWRIPQGVVNILDSRGSKIKSLRKDEEEDIAEVIFPDNVITIANFKNKHFGTPLTQVIIINNPCLDSNLSIRKMQWWRDRVKYII